jgi:glycosyltransferase involved in cell wall biosynthesis
MILVDAIYINNSGGKILLDYLIEILEGSSLNICYLLDERIKGNHPKITNNKLVYLKAGLLRRHHFYRKNRGTFTKILCFGNLPPTLRLEGRVFTYFHQKLFLEVLEETPMKQKMIFYIKSFIFQYFRKNTDFWIVQTQAMKEIFLKKTIQIKSESVLVIPFYPPLKSTVQQKSTAVFVYVSSGNLHKNHFNLIRGFQLFFDREKKGELHLTIGDEFTELIDCISKMNEQGYPVINHGFVSRDLIAPIYAKANFAIYPSLSESFGLGIIEAIENHCEVVGADLPYIYAVCNPSLVFDPLNVEDIANVFKRAVEEKIPHTEQLVFNEIDQLIALLK